MNKIVLKHPETNKPLKVVVVGDEEVGKTSLICKHITGTPECYYYRIRPFDYHHEQTVDGVTYQLKTLDVGGGEDYYRLRPLAYPETSVFIACFSLNCSESFSNITEKWLPELRTKGPPNVPVLLVGTKMDVRDNNQSHTLFHISPIKVAKLVKQEQLVQYIECSAKTGEGLTQVFDSAVKAATRISKRKTKICTIL